MIIARTAGLNGEAVLRRGSAGYELIVDGQFQMSSASGPSSEELVRIGLNAIEGASGLEVLIGGLGLGFSLRTALADPRVERVRVVEIEAALIDWHRQGLLPEAAEAVRDPRGELIRADLLEYLADCRAGYDLIALDIDNGPEWLSHPGNGGLYTRKMLTRIKSCLKPGGAATFWSADSSPLLLERLREVFGEVREFRSTDSNGEEKTIEAFIYLVKY